MEVAEEQEALWQTKTTFFKKMILSELGNTMTQLPAMAYPDFIQPFILHTGASAEGLDTVLYQ